MLPDRLKKNALKKINNKPRYLSVCRQRDLAICMLSVDRQDDAIAIVQFAQQGCSYRSGVDVWDATGQSAAVVAYMRRNEKDYFPTDELNKFIEQPAHALFTQPEIYTSSGILAHLEKERARHSFLFDNPDPNTALEAMCWWTSTLIFFRVFADLGYPRDKQLDVNELDKRINEMLKRIRQNVEDMAPKFVAPYRLSGKRGKNDAADAMAICEAEPGHGSS